MEKKVLVRKVAERIYKIFDVDNWDDLDWDSEDSEEKQFNKRLLKNSEDLLNYIQRRHIFGRTRRVK